MKRAVEGLGIAKDDLVPRQKLLVEVPVGEPAALTVLDRNDELLAGRATRRERRVRAFDDETHVAADERERLVRAEDAREQARFAEDLEAVADTEHEAAGRRKFGNRGHRRGEARDRAATEIVAVRETAGQDDRIQIGQLAFGMPDRGGLGVECGQRPERVAVVVRAGELDDPDPRPGRAHAPFSRSMISYDSISGLASSCSHICSTSRRAAVGSVVSTSRSTRRPMRACATVKPSCRSELSTASPWGSRMPCLGRTRTVAFT